MAKTDRVYKIEMLIRNRGLVSFQTLLEELEVSPATLKRDLAYLKDQLEAPIVYDHFENGYKFEQDRRGTRHELPGLWFNERELYSLLTANQLLSEIDADGVIHRHLQPLLDRVHRMLGPDEAKARSLLERVRIMSATRRPVPGKFFELAVEALLRRHRIRMIYLSRGRAEAGKREVSPQRLVYYKNTWYLDGWCHRTEKLRRFSMDAIEHAERLESQAHEIPVSEIAAAMDAGYGIYAGARRQWAVLSFDRQAAQWVSREEWHPEQKGRWVADGRYELQVPYADETELTMDILRHGGHVAVVAPASLRTRVRLQHLEAATLNAE